MSKGQDYCDECDKELAPTDEVYCEKCYSTVVQEREEALEQVTALEKASEVLTEELDTLKKEKGEG